MKDKDKVRRALARSKLDLLETPAPRVTIKAPRKLIVPPTIATWAHRDPAFVNACEHAEFRKVDKRIKQCKRCGWCKPRKKNITWPKLPALLAGRALPPASLHNTMYSYSGMLMSKRVRVREIQYTSRENPFIGHYSIEIKFDGVWCTACTLLATHWHKVAAILETADLDKPKKLWHALEEATGRGPWTPPWEMA